MFDLGTTVLNQHLYKLLVLLTKTFITADKEIRTSLSTDYTICKLNQYQPLACYCFWQ